MGWVKRLAGGLEGVKDGDKVKITQISMIILSKICHHDFLTSCSEMTEGWSRSNYQGETVGSVVCVEIEMDKEILLPSSVYTVY